MASVTARAGSRITADLVAAVADLAVGRPVPPGRLDRLRATDPLVAEIVTADAVCRVAGVGVAESRALVERARLDAPARPLLRWWATAVLAERALLDTDLAAVPLAGAALGEMPDDGTACPVVLFVRGRLRRAASVGHLASPSLGHRAAHRSARDTAMGDFTRGGYFAEVALTRILSAVWLALAAGEDLPECLVTVRDARSCLAGRPGADRPAWLALVDGLRMLVALDAGDLDEADAAAAAIDGAASAQPVLQAIAALGRGIAALGRRRGDDGSVAEVAAALDRLHRDHPPFLALGQMQAANLLADLGRGPPARRFGRAALDRPPAGPLAVHLHELLRARLDLLDSPAVAGDRYATVDALLDRFDAVGYRRAAGTWALRVSGDFDRAGAPQAAAALRRRGEAVVPRGGRRTPAERRWAAGAGADPLDRRPVRVRDGDVPRRPSPGPRRRPS